MLCRPRPAMQAGRRATRDRHSQLGSAEQPSQYLPIHRPSSRSVCHSSTCSIGGRAGREYAPWRPRPIKGSAAAAACECVAPPRRLSPARRPLPDALQHSQSAALARAGTHPVAGAQRLEGVLVELAALVVLAALKHAPAAGATPETMGSGPMGPRTPVQPPQAPCQTRRRQQHPHECRRARGGRPWGGSQGEAAGASCPATCCTLCTRQQLPGATTHL